jgi:hypothetical protein
VASDGNDGFAISNGVCCSVAMDPIFAGTVGASGSREIYGGVLGWMTGS